MRHRKLLLTAFFAVTLTAVAVANTRVVPSAQYPTIQSAINASVPGDQICVLPGTYVESIRYHNGVNGVDVHVVALAGPKVTTIDSSTLAAPAVVIDSQNGAGAILEGFTITTNLKARGVEVRSGSTPTIRGNIFSKCRPPSNGSGGGILVVDSGSSATIESNLFTGNVANDGAAIQLAETGADIINNRFIANTSIGGFSGATLDFGSNGSATINIVGNLFTGNRSTKGGGGVIFGTKGSLFVVNNTIADNIMLAGAPTIEPRQCAVVEIVNNILWNANGFELPSSTAWRVDNNVINDTAWQTGTNTGVAPTFLNQTLGDYRNAPLSSAVELGTLNVNVPLPANDEEGDPRWVDADGNGTAEIDAGCDEFDACAYLANPIKAGTNAVWTYKAPTKYNGNTFFGYLSAGAGENTPSGKGIPLPDGSGRFLALDNDGWYMSSQLVPMVMSQAMSTGTAQTVPFMWNHNVKGKEMYYAGLVMDLSTGAFVKVLPTQSFTIQ